MNKSIFKSIGAILAGMIAGAILSIATDFILERTGIFPAPKPGLFLWWMLLIALIYRSIFTIVSGFITALLAPKNPVKHSVILGIIGVVVTLLGSIANWDKSAAWYPILLIIVTLPSTWLGGKAFMKHKA